MNSRKRELDAKRGTSTHRGYDAVWRRLRTMHLAREPLCRFCSAMGRTIAASVVDHIQSIADAPALRLEPSNLRSLCKRCHDSHTAHTQGFAKNSTKQRRIGCDVSGNPIEPMRHWS